MTIEELSNPVGQYQGKTEEEYLEIIRGLEFRIKEDDLQCKELVLAQSNYRRFFDTIDDLLFVLDLNGIIIQSNDAAKQRLGYSSEELTGNPVSFIYPAELRIVAERILKEVAEGNMEVSTVPLLTKSGDFIPAETNAKPGLWDGKQAIFAVCKDVLKIRQSEEKFATAFHVNPTMMSITRFDDGRFIDVNDIFLKNFGYSRKEVIGRSFKEITSMPEPEIIQDIRRKLLSNISVREMEGKVRSRTGQEFTFLFSADYIYVGNDLCFMVTGIDITLRKHAESDILKARNQAEKANQAKSEFISRMSHELRTPMNSILGFSQLMSMGEVTPAQRKGINHILNSGKHLLSLINEVLDISRIEAGSFSLTPVPVQLEGIIREMTDVISPVAQKRKIKTELENSPSNSLFVFADRLSLKQVLLNLINNAVKYNREGGSVLINTRIVDNASGTDNAVRISVIDTGHGIRPEDIGRLFSPFERIGAENTEIEGSGLGLSLVKKLVTSMKGEVGVASTHGKGSTFWIDLPLAEGVKGSLVNAEKVDGGEIAQNGCSGTVLYFENNISNIELAEEVLRSQRPSVRIISCRHGAKAVSIARECLPDLILLDLSLPDLHGADVLSRLKNDIATNDIPVIIISADVRPDQIKSILKNGASDYLTQPLELTNFLFVIDKYLGNKNR
jgi:PAS domain S-box-containing protein